MSYLVRKNNDAWVLCSTDFQIGDKVVHPWGMTGEIAEQPNKAIRERFLIQVDDGTMTSGYLGGWHRLIGVVTSAPENFLQNYRNVSVDKVFFEDNMPFGVDTPRNYNYLAVKITIK